MLTLFWLLAPAAPAAEPIALSIEDALRRAQQASEDVEIANAEVSGAEGDRWAARSGFFPQISASLTYQRTLATEFDDLFTPPDTPGDPTGTPTTPPTTDTTPPTTTTGTGTPTGTPPQGGGGLGDIADNLPFGQPNTWRAAISVNQQIFGGGRTLALTRVANAGARAARIGLESARAAVALNTASAYYDAVLADQLLEIATSTLSQTETTQRQTELGQSVGSQPEFELLRARVAVENQQVAVIAARRQRDLARWRLAQLLDLPPDQPIELTSALDPDAVAAAAAEVAGAAPPDRTRAPVRQLRELAAISDANVAVTRADALPNLGASLSLGWVSFPSTLWPLGEGKPWYASSTGGVALNVPVLNGGRTYGALRRARADALKAQVRLDQTEELAALDTRSAQNDLDAATAQWQATEGAVEQARRAYEIAELRFGEGVSTQIELSDARLQLERALVNRAQAARDLAVARTRLALIASLPVPPAIGP